MKKTAEAGACSKSASGEACSAAKTAEAGACASKAAGACATKAAEGACCEGKDILSVAKSHEDFSTLMLAAEKAGVTESFSCTEPKTVFAPTNDAFKKIPAEQLTALLEDKEKLRAILARHIVPGVVKAEDLKKLTSTKVGDGKELPVSTCSQSGTVSIGNAKVVRTEVASNGMIYALDSVLMPEEKTAAAPAPEEAVKVATK
ncbi:MAG: fasciclin domain-containing protein [Candidatus Hydrogenedentes bacterium]|nr:fasciclin domain-containing protein [Candidatus Hydrogenedentota bacterium]